MDYERHLEETKNAYRAKVGELKQLEAQLVDGISLALGIEWEPQQSEGWQATSLDDLKLAIIARDRAFAELSASSIPADKGFFRSSRPVASPTLLRWASGLAAMTSLLIILAVCRHDVPRWLPMIASILTGRYVVPEFGFVSESGAPADVPPSRPERYPFPRVHFWGPSLEPEETVRLRVGEFEVQAISAHRGRLAALNTCFGAGFKLCFRCGYAVPGTEKNPQSHKDAYGKPCSGTLQRVSLGHESETDVLLVYFLGYYDRNISFWPSLLYGLLEGLSLTLDIERFDLDGCLYPRNGQLASPALVLYDNVPGGAGHVRRVADQGVLRDVLEVSRAFLSSCECGTSCSGCLRNFRNQYWHDKLNRHLVLDFLNKVLG